MHIATVAIDLAKTVFEVAAADATGRVVERKRLSRSPARTKAGRRGRCELVEAPYGCESAIPPGRRPLTSQRARYGWWPASAGVRLSIIICTAASTTIMKESEKSRTAEERGRELADAVGSNDSRGVDRGANDRGRQLAQAIPAEPSAADARLARIARVAYSKAEQRGFHSGGELDDWLAAERECDEQEGRGVVG